MALRVVYRRVLGLIAEGLFKIEIPPDPEGVDFDIPGLPSDDLRRAISVSKVSFTSRAP
jgi:hypothetical protein